MEMSAARRVTVVNNSQISLAMIGALLLPPTALAGQAAQSAPGSMPQSRYGIPLRPTVQSSLGSIEIVSGVNGSEDGILQSLFTSVALKLSRSGRPVVASVLK